jgi:ubiquinone/menaquinone biosynthesis C-methylase UbiE
MIQDPFYTSGTFERWLRNPPPKIKDYLRKEAAYLSRVIKNNSTVLDVGCGFGRHMEFLAPNVRKIIGIDHNSYMINKAKKIIHRYTNTEALIANAINLPFRDNEFDYVICMLNTFGDWGNLKVQILREMRRVSNGKIIISVWSDSSLEERVKAYKRASVEIEDVRGNTILLKNSHTSEAFKKEQLVEIFNSAYLNPLIIPLSGIAYLLEADK